MTDQIETELREMFARRAAKVPSEAATRLLEIDYRPSPRQLALARSKQFFSGGHKGRQVSGRFVLRTVCASGALAAGAAAAIILAGGDAQSAFAGWRAVPTQAASGQIQAAESECRRNSALASRTPAVADTRGPYTLLVYADASGVGLCITGPSFDSPTGEPPFAPFRDDGISPTTPIAADAIRRTDTGSVLTKTSPIAEFDFNAGRVGAAVKAVTIVLGNGSRVQATVSNGLFAADWPGNQQAQTAEIATTSGTTVQQSMPTSEPSASH